MKLTGKGTLGLAATAAVVTGTLAGVWAGSHGAETPSRGSEVVLAQADDVLPSVTSTDWVTYADRVVVVRPTSDREIPATEEENEAGEGYIGRSATLAVDKVLWSRSGAPAVPRSLTLDVAGWAFKDDQRQEFAVHDTPRLETGHTYIVALARLDDGTWSILGSGASLPYDGGVIGNGESEGNTVEAAKPASKSVSAARTAPGTSHDVEDSVEDSVEAQVNGESDDALVSLLNDTAPAPDAS
ncbi:hypothetical protein ACFYNZ_16640 [Streptomyces kebangsaanensis]|uniref:Uncharacterized protein n=1 Tax=Streptomyces kebangsaanensis TaxID=864058 RepID=A0ABW6KTK3_9ACTN